MGRTRGTVAARERRLAAQRAAAAAGPDSVNFVLDRSKNYREVQRTLVQSVAVHLAQVPLPVTESVGRLVDDALNVSLFVRQPADVVMSHGVADKNYFIDVRDSDDVPFANRLTGLLVPGAWLKRRLVAHPDITLSSDQIHVVGWPRLDLLRAAAKDMPDAPPSPRVRVLWAPTHDFRKRGEEEESTSSYPAFAEHLQALEDHVDVEVSLHPRNRSNKVPTHEALLEADVVISDFGTLVYEAWALGKPVVFPRWILGDRIQEYLPGSAEAQIFEERIGLHAWSFTELVDLVMGNPRVGPEVDSFMIDYLANYRTGSAGRRCATTLRSIAPPPRPGAVSSALSSPAVPSASSPGA